MSLNATAANLAYDYKVVGNSCYIDLILYFGLYKPPEKILRTFTDRVGSARLTNDKLRSSYLWFRVTDTLLNNLLSTYANRQGVDISFTVFLFVCVCVYVSTVTDFSIEDTASGVKFCTADHWRPRQGISHLGELCFSKSPKSERIGQRNCRKTMNVPVGDSTCGRRIGMYGWRSVPADVLVMSSVALLTSSADCGVLTHSAVYAIKSDSLSVVPWVVNGAET